jgi:hypothetical protein
MKTRFVILLLALAAGVGAALQHGKMREKQARLEADIKQLQAVAAENRRTTEETAQLIAVARAERPASLGGKTDNSAAQASSISKAKAAEVPSEDLLRLQEQAYVSEQRLRYAALLKRLGFTPEKLSAFDDIQRAYQTALSTGPRTEDAQRQALEAREAQLQPLFGAEFAQWTNAYREQPARAIVNQIVQQTFQGSGALTTGQADELIRIVAQYRNAPVKEGGAAQPSYDWDKIVTEASTVLADRQIADFITAIEFRRASEKMSALATKKKS